LNGTLENRGFGSFIILFPIINKVKSLSEGNKLLEIFITQSEAQMGTEGIDLL